MEEGRRSLWVTGVESTPGEPTKKPYPFSSAGRVWAIMRAGKAASVTLVCHRDTWEFVAAQVGNHPHFRTPALEEREGGLVAAVLSGRSLVAVLLSLYHVAKTRRHGEGVDELVTYADWAMASQVYDATARVLSRTFVDEGDPVDLRHRVDDLVADSARRISAYELRLDDLATVPDFLRAMPELAGVVLDVP
ncbi:hypothetical protein [Streptomyces griseus]